MLSSSCTCMGRPNSDGGHLCRGSGGKLWLWGKEIGQLSCQKNHQGRSQVKARADFGQS